MKYLIDDIHISNIKPVIPPISVREKHPITEQITKNVFVLARKYKILFTVTIIVFW
jgi:3-deoxy-D-arabino-heptulosonate 7-phosphate (DAHP) synthase